MTDRIYHVGLLQRDRTAVYQYRASVDQLDCEILEYFGERVTTKAAVKARLRLMQSSALEQLNRDYPKCRFERVEID